MIDSRASPIAGPGVVNRNSSRRQFLQQQRHRWRNFTIARDDHCPFQVFPKLPHANAPQLQGDRRGPPNLYQRPVPGESQCRLSIRNGAAHDEMIFPYHQNSDHTVSRLKPRIGRGAANRKVIDHLPRKFAGIFAWSSLVLVPPQVPLS